MNFNFDKIEEMLKPTSQKYLFQNVFQIELDENLICNHCKKVTKYKATNYSLSVEVKNIKTVEEGMKKYFMSEQLEDRKCDECKEKGSTKSSAIKKLPNFLIVHLTRFAFDMETYRTEKQNSEYKFGNTLNLQDYHIDKSLD